MMHYLSNNIDVDIHHRDRFLKYFLCFTSISSFSSVVCAQRYAVLIDTQTVESCMTKKTSILKKNWNIFIEVRLPNFFSKK